jgi:hypothetical protein
MSPEERNKRIEDVQRLIDPLLDHLIGEDRTEITVAVRADCPAEWIDLHLVIGDAGGCQGRQGG